jgi:hypothetical protein
MVGTQFQIEKPAKVNTCENRGFGAYFILGYQYIYSAQQNVSRRQFHHCSCS